jgi:hypothetical protein
VSPIRCAARAAFPSPSPACHSPTPHHPGSHTPSKRVSEVVRRCGDAEWGLCSLAPRAPFSPPPRVPLGGRPLSLQPCVSSQGVHIYRPMIQLFQELSYCRVRSDAVSPLNIMKGLFVLFNIVTDFMIAVQVVKIHQWVSGNVNHYCGCSYPCTDGYYSPSRGNRACAVPVVTNIAAVLTWFVVAFGAAVDFWWAAQSPKQRKAKEPCCGCGAPRRYALLQFVEDGPMLFIALWIHNAATDAYTYTDTQFDIQGLLAIFCSILSLFSNSIKICCGVSPLEKALNGIRCIREKEERVQEVRATLSGELDPSTLIGLLLGCVQSVIPLTSAKKKNAVRKPTPRVPIQASQEVELTPTVAAEAVSMPMRSGTASDSTRVDAPVELTLKEMSVLLNEQLRLRPTNVADSIAQACRELGVQTEGKNLVEKAREACAVLGIGRAVSV